jgi:DNA-binding transcriptional ArsR family regulator
MGDMKLTPDNLNEKVALADILETVGRTNKKPPRHKPGERFLKGPIPWKWIVKAAEISASSLAVALGIWFLAGVTNSAVIKLSNKILGELGVSERTKYRVLRAMEEAGLVSVVQEPGSSPKIRINPV